MYRRRIHQPLSPVFISSSADNTFFSRGFPSKFNARIMQWLIPPLSIRYRCMALWQKRWPFKTIETLYKGDFSRVLFMYVWALTFLNIYSAVTGWIGCCWKMCFSFKNSIFVSYEWSKHWQPMTKNNDGSQAGHSNSKQTMKFQPSFKSWRWWSSPSWFDEIVIWIELTKFDENLINIYQRKLLFSDVTSCKSFLNYPFTSFT